MVTSVVVGSSAIKCWLGDKFREPNDVDIWQDYPVTGTKFDRVEMPREILSLFPSGGAIASLDELYTIKCSHLGWDILWEKHKKDVLLLKHHGAKLIPKLYLALVEHWKKEHGNKDFLSLYKTKPEFFTDGVEYVCDHDYLHELVAHPNLPVYTKCLKDKEDVAIDYDKFMQLPFSERVRMFREEISVIACERWLIPDKYRGKVKWHEAYRYALRKTITSLTKNWATEFLVLNLEEFVKPDFSYFKYLLKTLNLEEEIMGKQITIEESDKVREELFLAYIEANPDSYRAKGYSTGEEDLSEEAWNFFTEQVLGGIDSWGNKVLPEGYKHLHQDGGGEGGAEGCITVFEWKGVCYSFAYSYYSHHGYQYFERSLRVVEPKEKTITVYV